MERTLQNLSPLRQLCDFRPTMFKLSWLLIRLCRNNVGRTWNQHSSRNTNILVKSKRRFPHVALQRPLMLSIVLSVEWAILNELILVFNFPFLQNINKAPGFSSVILQKHFTMKFVRLHIQLFIFLKFVFFSKRLHCRNDACIYFQNLKRRRWRF